MQKLLFLFLLVSLQTNAQKAAIDSLFIVQNYLSEIRNTVNSKKSHKHKLEKLGSLIQSADTQKAIFNRNITKIAGTTKDTEQLKSSLNSILQSVILYRSDLKNNYKSQSEIIFLNKNIPVLVYKIDFHCTRAKIRLEENTH